MCFLHPFAFISGAVLFYRSKLVVDAERGIVCYAWGFVRPWFRSYMPLAELTSAMVHTWTGARGGTSHYVRLEYRGDERRDYGASAKDAREATEQINGYLQKIRFAAELRGEASV
jgi:hypothetical protein